MKEIHKKLEALIKEMRGNTKFDNPVIQLPSMAGGPFKTKQIAVIKLQRLVKNSPPGKLLYLKLNDDGWMVMARLTKRGEGNPP